MTTNTNFPNPLGFCRDCITEARRVPATTLHAGAAMCDVCVLAKLVPDPSEREMTRQKLVAIDQSAASAGGWAHGA